MSYNLKFSSTVNGRQSWIVGKIDCETCRCFPSLDREYHWSICGLIISSKKFSNSWLFVGHQPIQNLEIRVGNSSSELQKNPLCAWFPGTIGWWIAIIPKSRMYLLDDWSLFVNRSKNFRGRIDEIVHLCTRINRPIRILTTSRNRRISVAVRSRSIYNRWYVHICLL